MIDLIQSFVTRVASSVRPADVVDILVAAAFIYGTVYWLRQSRSPRLARSVFSVLIVLVVLYATAYKFEMVLLESLVIVTFLLVLLGAAVFFQKDIQRTLDRLLLLRFRRTGSEETVPISPVRMLCDAAGALAAKKQGALIAIRGNQSWSRHIEGGVRLEGIVSMPLLLSLFDPASAGHDGAVLIEGEVITHFGTHLPLSIAGPLKGTRHAAGLGLSEQSDAFVIIVSEERGTISVARHGELIEVPSAGALKRLLDPFWKEHYAVMVPILSRWKRIRHVMTPLFSLAFAVVLWLLFGYSPIGAIQTFTVPIEYVNLAPELQLTDPGPSSAMVTLSGSERAFQLFQPSALMISIDLSEIAPGTNRLAITERNMQIPKGWELYSVEPDHVTVRARPRAP